MPKSSAWNSNGVVPDGRGARAWRYAAAGCLIASVATLGTPPILGQAQYAEIRRLGTNNAISRPGPRNAAELERVFRTNRADYEKVLRDASWPGNPEDLFRAVASGAFSEAHYPVGHTFEWMAVRKGGVAQPTGPVRWAGDEPFEAFEIRFESGGRAHRFLIPKACGNLALVAMGPTEEQIRREQERQHFRGTTPELHVQAPSSCTGTEVTVDVGVAGGIPEGGSLRLTLAGPGGTREALAAVQTGGSFRWQGKLEDAGSYVFTAVVDSPLGESREALGRLTLEACVPDCSIALTPPAGAAPRRGRASVEIDLCASAAIVGRIESHSVDVYHGPVGASERLFDTLALGGECRASFLLPEYGRYRFQATVTDDRGASSTCPADHTLVEPERRLEPFFIAFAGNERRWRAGIESDPGFQEDRSAPLLGGTVGLALPLAGASASIFGQGGVAANLRDGDNTSIFADFGVDKNFEGGGFLGGGAGVWDVNHGDTFDGTIFVHGGFAVHDRIQLLFEGRLFLSMLDSVDNNYVYSAGIRYFWKR